MHEIIHRLRFITERLFLLEKSIGSGYIEAQDYTDFETPQIPTPHIEAAIAEPKRSIIDLGATYLSSSAWDGYWTNPRLDSPSGFHNGMGQGDIQQWW